MSEVGSPGNLQVHHQIKTQPARGRCAREPCNALRVLPLGRARAAFLFRPSSQSLQQAKTTNEVKKLRPVLIPKALSWLLMADFTPCSRRSGPDVAHTTARCDRMLFFSRDSGL